MAEVIRIEEMKISDAEKKLIIRALTDKAFRDELLRTVSGGSAELSDNQLAGVTGGVTSLTLTQIRAAIISVNDIQSRIAMGAQVLCAAYP